MVILMIQVHSGILGRDVTVVLNTQNGTATGSA